MVGRRRYFHSYRPRPRAPLRRPLKTAAKDGSSYVVIRSVATCVLCRGGAALATGRGAGPGPLAGVGGEPRGRGVSTSDEDARPSSLTARVSETSAECLRSAVCLSATRSPSTGCTLHAATGESHASIPSPKRSRDCRDHRNRVRRDVRERGLRIGCHDAARTVVGDRNGDDHGDIGWQHGCPVFDYSAAGSSGSWTFSATATSARNQSIKWRYKGYHAWYQVRVAIEQFVVRDGTEIVTRTLKSDGPVNCCTAPSGGFDYTGIVMFDLRPGDVYGFRMSGSNGDSDRRLIGTLSLTIAPPPPPPVEAPRPPRPATTASAPATSISDCPSMTLLLRPGPTGTGRVTPGSSGTRSASRLRFPRQFSPGSVSSLQSIDSARRTPGISNLYEEPMDNWDTLATWTVRGYERASSRESLSPRSSPICCKSASPTVASACASPPGTECTRHTRFPTRARLS